MGVKVAKFGGSSVADALQIGKIKNIIENDPDIHYVVVSAPGKRFSDDSKVTDLLYLCKAHIEHNLPYQQIFQVICDQPAARGKFRPALRPFHGGRSKPGCECGIKRRI